MSKPSPSSRTLQLLRAEGWTVQVVEKRNYSGVTQDLFGFIDILAMRGPALLAIQATSGTHHAARVAKAIAEPRLKQWLATGNFFAVWSWRKAGPRGGFKRWKVRRELIELPDPPSAKPDPSAKPAKLFEEVAAGTFKEVVTKLDLAKLHQPQGPGEAT